VIDKKRLRSLVSCRSGILFAGASAPPPAPASRTLSATSWGHGRGGKR
jgi:hypothetical protein